ncbi:flagellar hook-length control protein FliK [Sulfuriferula thiophila]|uniref:flagellar hook-length control protein FliK n=1 Tax=Sulfuriferula thiophila TaxID=1781211 RepID=UPI001CB8A3E6|nr:flagellar hook-length control protein FliK [Sulfuriferula thiophila]
MAVTPITITPQASVDKTANTTTPDVPFNRVLSNEMAQHQQPKTSGKSASKDGKVDTQQSSDKVDSKTQIEDTSPQASAEMLAMLGNLQPATTLPQDHVAKTDSQPLLAGTKAAGSSQDMLAAISGRNLQAAVANNLAGQDIAQNNALTTRQSASLVTDKLAMDSAKPDTMQELRADAKFADTLKNADVMLADPRNIRMDNNINALDTQAQNQLLATAAVAQPSTIDMAQNLAGQLTDKLTPRVGTPAWDQALGQKIVWMVGGATQTASISLNPPDLGPLQVVLNVTNDQASATFIAAQPEVRQAIEAAMPKLREMMSDAGIQLGQANVSADNSSQQGSQPDSRTPRQSSSISEITTENINIPRKTVTSQGLVNTFV